MINNIQINKHPSFKSVYIRNDFKNELNLDNQKKMGRVFGSLDYLFPLNDILVHKESNGTLKYNIKKAHPAKLLLLPQAESAINDKQRTKTEVNLAIAFDYIYKKLHNIKDVNVSKEIKRFEEKSEDEINQIMINDVLDFNYEHPENIYDA